MFWKWKVKVFDESDWEAKTILLVIVLTDLQKTKSYWEKMCQFLVNFLMCSCGPFILAFVLKLLSFSVFHGVSEKLIHSTDLFIFKKELFLFILAISQVEGKLLKVGTKNLKTILDTKEDKYFKSYIIIT